MSQERETSRDTDLYLVSIICGIAAAALILLYCLWVPEYRISKLVIAMIPSAVVALIAVPIVYFIFARHGIHFSPSNSQSTPPTLDYDTMKTVMSEQLDERMPYAGLPALISAYETYRDIDWNWLLGQAREQVDIVVYYFDSWVKANHESLKAYFQRNNTKMRIFVADPRDEDIVDTVDRLFPDYSREDVLRKISLTGERVRGVMEEAGASPDRFQFYYVPHVLNYSAQCIDGRFFVLSVFEMFRKNKIDSPAVVFDLNKSEHLANYWKKELDGLLEVSEQVQEKHT